MVRKNYQLTVPSVQENESDESNDIIGESIRIRDNIRNLQANKNQTEQAEEPKFLPPPNPILDKRFEDQ